LPDALACSSCVRVLPGNVTVWRDVAPPFAVAAAAARCSASGRSEPG
jgi:hypothetical protein